MNSLYEILFKIIKNIETKKHVKIFRVSMFNGKISTPSGTVDLISIWLYFYAHFGHKTLPIVLGFIMLSLKYSTLGLPDEGKSKSPSSYAYNL